MDSIARYEFAMDIAKRRGDNKISLCGIRFSNFITNQNFRITRRKEMASASHIYWISE